MIGECAFFFLCVPLVEGPWDIISRSSWSGSLDARVGVVVDVVLCYQIKEIRVEPQASTRRSEQFVGYKTKKGTADHYDQNFKLCPKTMRSFVILKARLFSFFPLSDLIALRLNERWRWRIESCQKKIIPC